MKERGATGIRVQKSKAQAKVKRTSCQTIEEMEKERGITQIRKQKSRAQAKRKQKLEQKKTGREHTKKGMKRSRVK